MGGLRGWVEKVGQERGTKGCLDSDRLCHRT